VGDERRLGHALAWDNQRRQRGPANAIWVWSPNCKSIPNDAWNYFTNYYPGHDYVDWVTCDGYNRGGSSWRPWSYTYGNAWDGRLSVYASYPEKPFMVSETGSCELGGDKGAWITRARNDIKASFPRVKAFVWFNENKECDWRAESSTGALDAFRGLVEDPYFQGSGGPPPPAAGARSN
jgi:mannan endo-1,4-beta-mannosidase